MLISLTTGRRININHLFPDTFAGFVYNIIAIINIGTNFRRSEQFLYIHGGYMLPSLPATLFTVVSQKYMHNSFYPIKPLV